MDKHDRRRAPRLLALNPETIRRLTGGDVIEIHPESVKPSECNMVTACLPPPDL